MRDTSSAVWKYFSKAIDETLCNLCTESPCKNCTKEKPCKLQGIKVFNAKRHLKFSHKNEHQLIEEKCVKRSRRNREVSTSQNISSLYTRVRESSEVWKYFSKLFHLNQALCNLCAELPCRNCTKDSPCKLRGILAFNAKRHLKFSHKDEHKIVEEKDCQKDVVKNFRPDVVDVEEKHQCPTKKQKVDETIMSSKPSSAAQFDIEKQKSNLAKFLAKPTIALSIVRDYGFREFLQNYDHSYELPKSDVTAKQILREECNRVTNKISTSLSRSLSKITLSLYTWSQRYFGVMAHYISEDFLHKRVFLGLDSLPSNCDDHILDIMRQHLAKILSIYNIKEEDVFLLIADNASNVVKAATVSTKHVNQYSIDNCEVVPHDFESDINLINKSNISADVCNFDHVRQEPEFSLIFKNRITSVQHALHMVMRSVYQKLPSSDVIENAKAICSRVNLSYQMTSGARWYTSFKMVERLLFECNKAPEQDILGDLTAAEIEYLTAFKDLLKPFNDYFICLHNDSQSFSKVYQKVHNLCQHTQNFKCNFPEIDDSAYEIFVSLIEMFKHDLNYFIEKPEDFFSTFALGALFDPSQAHHIKFSPYDLKTMISSCVEFDESVESNKWTTVGDGEEATSSDEDCRRELLSNLLATSSTFSPQTIAENYLVKAYKTARTDALVFWKNINDELLSLRRSALSHLAIPVTSYPLSNAFRSAGICTEGIKDKTQLSLLNMKLIVHLNRDND